VSEVEAIRGTYSNLLRGVKIALVVSSGVSLYKSIDVARLLIRHGADVYVFMTPKAARLVSPHLFWWATGNKPVVRLTGAAEHIEICGRADVLLVAPATANTLVKLSLGIADNAALTCALAASRARKVIVPAMNLAMWNTPQVQEAVRRLGKEALVVPPLVEEGKAKYPPPEDVVEYVIDATAPRDYDGKRVLVTAGPTREYLDDVKFITTPSSGLTGYYFAREAAARGAEVTLVTGPTDLKLLRGEENKREDRQLVAPVPGDVEAGAQDGARRQEIQSQRLRHRLQGGIQRRRDGASGEDEAQDGGGRMGHGAGPRCG
jgi:phosphopantothenoylcysteine decarboxylase/phosphopantothenate--cysteine ligase